MVAAAGIDNTIEKPTYSRAAQAAPSATPRPGGEGPRHVGIGADDEQSRCGMRRSALLPRRGLLLEDRAHALCLVPRFHHEGEQALLIAEALAQGHPRRRADGSLLKSH